MKQSTEYKFGDSFIKGDLPICVYCGDPSTDRDHLIPCSWEGYSLLCKQRQVGQSL